MSRQAALESTSHRDSQAHQSFLGHCRIIEMEQWDSDYIDMVVPGYVEFEKDGLGYFRFGTVQGELDCERQRRQAG